MLKKYVFIVSALFFCVQALGASKVSYPKHTFADRYYISSVLIDAFGPEAKPIIISNIMKNGNIFGGPCDIYEQIKMGPKNYLNDVMTRCYKGKHEFNFPMHAKPSLLREALMNKTCSELVENSETFKFIRNKLNGMINLDKNLMYQIGLIFDPNDIPNEKIINYHLEKIKNFYWERTKQKYLIYQVCTYPQWQLI